jgi:methylated-DNA-protein-cysteine methyltransferase-like protein
MAVVEALSPGEVVSYGDVAAQAGYPGAGRGVGSVLATATRPLPWWRVVYADGRLAPGKEDDQGRRLRAEGVTVRDGRVGGRHPLRAPAPYAVGGSPPAEPR